MRGETAMFALAATAISAVALVSLAILAAASSRGLIQTKIDLGLIGSDAMQKYANADDTDESADHAVKYCGKMEEDVDFLGTTIAHLPDIKDAATCCAKCQENPQCRVWMWGKARGMPVLTDGGDNVCTLRSIDPHHRVVEKLPRRGVVSGLPFQWDRYNSLFCFVLMQPHGYEPDLMKMHYSKGWSIFQCDEFELVSNQTIKLAPGVVTSSIASDLRCEKGGEFGTALNTPIFHQVWKKIFEDGRYQFNAWTVKVDPDCAFFPDRLRVAVAFHPDTYHGLYLNNCKFGLHGPLEVFSLQAVRIWSTGYQTCNDHFTKLCSGPCLWGEDMFIDQCLQKVLKVHRANDWNLLSEPHCDSDDWEQCSNHKVAFHPFKTKEDFSECMRKADYGALPILA
eukprot:CAMPEP_0115394408 /NCGR_PEP_ID=MMETSP0271-20121206/12251_1 /TAXON_ID=71861 /ORGANISM="Scrippsiella trochoidea, Strain CCMP3099" /LENGTH=395 /DNA_ID=CAMNT_0002818079 /DNA_START=246 /DNA_END=1434 /DNA_ORIENTATION=-